MILKHRQSQKQKKKEVMAEEGRHDACEEDMEFPSKVQSYRESVKRKRPTMKIARLN